MARDQIHFGSNESNLNETVSSLVFGFAKSLDKFLLQVAAWLLRHIQVDCIGVSLTHRCGM
jgi:hypothetical protein